MPQQCIICSHPEKAKIDAALLQGVPFRRIAKRFGTSLGSLSRHKKGCLGKKSGVVCCPNTEKKQIEYGKWEKGVSGNPSGRPKGSLNKKTIIAQELLDGEADHITRKLVDAAKAGDDAAIKLCVERILPKRVTSKDAYVEFELPEVKDMHSFLEAHNMIVQAAARGDITPMQAESFSMLMDKIRKLVTLAAYVDQSIKAAEGGNIVDHEQLNDLRSMPIGDLSRLTDEELEWFEKIMIKLSYGG